MSTLYPILLLCAYSPLPLLPPLLPSQLLCRDANKARDFTLEPGTRVTTDPNVILDDPEIDVIVEVIGGTGSPARELVLGAASRGKHVVTANKALLAEALLDVRKSFSSRRQLGYEAAVAGGVPIIRAMQESLLPDSITRVAGIMNGTTNYIMTAMAAEGRSYTDALKGAQAAGFAEADPTADVEGLDARNKLVLLTQLAFGVYVPPARVRTTGITGVTAFDVTSAASAGFAVKLLGVSELFDATAATTAVVEGETKVEVEAEVSSSTPSSAVSATGKPALRKRLLDVFISPALVPLRSSLGETGGAGNIVLVDSESLGTSTFAGAGAGRYPTALSVVADLMAIARGTNSKRAFPRPPPAKVGLSIKPSDSFERNFYVRAPAALADLLSVALWRQGRFITPCGGTGAPGGKDEGVKAFLVDASARELASLIKRAAKKIVGNGDDADAAAILLSKQVALYPVIGAVKNV